MFHDILNYSRYYYELLPETFKKLSARTPSVYEGTWNLWEEGIANGLIIPQFHGREHLNVKVFQEKLKKKKFLNMKIYQTLLT